MSISLELPIYPAAGYTTAVPASAAAPFLIWSADDADGAKVRVFASTLIGDTPAGFSAGDDPPFVVAVADGDQVYVAVSWDVSGEQPGDVTSRTLGVGATVPADDPGAGTFYRRLGTVSVAAGISAPFNLRYGPVEGTCFRIWFTTPKQFGVAWSGGAEVLG